MKLIYCPICHDMARLVLATTVSCICEASWGQYEDHLNATYGGKAIPLGIDNASLRRALWDRPESGQGSEFTAFVIPVECSTFKKEEA